MELIIWSVLILVVVGIVYAIANTIPFPAPVAWLRWALPAVALLIALVIILDRLAGTTVLR